MDSRSEALKVRTKQFALRIIRMSRALPPTLESRVIGKQLLRLPLRWRPIIDPLAGRVLGLSFSPKWELLWRKRMRVPSGLSSLPMLKLSTKNGCAN